MIYLPYEYSIELHRLITAACGGSLGIRDDGALQSAVDQPQMSAFGADLYPDIAEKAAALGFSLIMNHAFIDGNKRIGHAAIEQFLMENGFEIEADVDTQEKLILEVAASRLSRDEFTEWLKLHIVPIRDE